MTGLHKQLLWIPLLLIALTFPVLAAGTNTAQPACPAVASAVLGARQVAVMVRRWQENAGIDAVFMKDYGEIPLYQSDPLGCLAAAVQLAAAEGPHFDKNFGSVSLVDLNGDGIPELFMPGREGTKGSSATIYDISIGRLREIVTTDCFLWKFGRIWDENGVPGMCVMGNTMEATYRTDVVFFFFYDAASGWRVQEGRLAANVLQSGEEPPRTGWNVRVRINGAFAIDPGSKTYSRMMAQPIERYRDMDDIAASADNALLPGMNLDHIPLDEPAAAREIAGRLLEAWNNFEPAAPVTGCTVLDVLEGNIPEE